ncbi:MAG: GNAT family N-acetyltransferase [Candidatus Promineofilum sp.]|nr:GNAT family N-acetyltransferase [Promineifilum sp.]
MMSFSQEEIRSIGPEDVAALFVVHAAITPTDAGQLLAWTQAWEARLESGGRAWVVGGGRRLAGYAVVDPVPGLPGIYDLEGGIVTARRRQGLGTMLLRHVQRESAEAGGGQLSCRLAGLEDEAAQFLLKRDFYVEHEECLLELADLDQLPLPAEWPGDMTTFPQAQAVSEFGRIYEESFAGMPWSQPYTEAEVAAALVRPQDLLFAVVEGRPVGVVWHELLSDGRGRIEPIGIARRHQGRGVGRGLLLAALHDLRRRGARTVEIGLWRQNTVAMNLYKSLGFLEVGNWYYLACELEGLKTE